MTLRKRTHKRSKQIAVLIVLLTLFFIIIPKPSPETSSWLFHYRYVPVLVALAISVGLIWYKLSHRLPHNAIDTAILKSLTTMDKTASWYRDEDEANKELVLCCKMNGLHATYQYKLPSGRVADALINGYLIEGKLSPDLAETDRLIGQMSEYGRLNYQTSIVIYGSLAQPYRNRIEQEIRQRYSNKISLVYLNNPQRQRSLSW